MAESAAAAIELPVERETVFDPPARLAAMREERPLWRLRYRSGEDGWLVTDYALARAVLADPRFTLAESKPFPTEDPALARMLQQMEEGLGGAGNLLAMDAPDHLRIRRLLAGEFSARRMAGFRPHLSRIVGDRLDAILAAGPPTDLVASFAKPVALQAHCALLGVPAEDSSRLSTVNQAVTRPGSTPAQIEAAFAALCDYLTSLFARKRAAPGDDLLSRLLASEELSGGELLNLTMMLFNAGVDTVEAMLASGPFALLCHPAQLRALRSEPDSIDGAVEELMRYLTVFKVGAITRSAGADLELAGETIRAGDPITVSLAAANRDPARFDSPDELDVRRSARGQLGFGHGPHVCLGQHLARLELRLGIGELLRRLPALRLAVAEEEVPVAGSDRLIFSLDELPVAW